MLSIQRAQSITQGQSASTCTKLRKMPFLPTPLKYLCASAKAPLSTRFPHLMPHCFTGLAKGNQGKCDWNKLLFYQMYGEACPVQCLCCFCPQLLVLCEYKSHLNPFSISTQLTPPGILHSCVTLLTNIR